MLPTIHRNKRIFIEVWHGDFFVGQTAVITPRDFPVKYKRNLHFSNSLFFDGVQFLSNEPFEFIIKRDNGDGTATILERIVLFAKDIQNNFYPRLYPKIETFPAKKDVFIDLYIHY